MSEYIKVRVHTCRQQVLELTGSGEKEATDNLKVGSNELDFFGYLLTCFSREFRSMVFYICPGLKS